MFIASIIKGREEISKTNLKKEKKKKPLIDLYPNFLKYRNSLEKEKKSNKALTLASHPPHTLKML